MKAPNESESDVRERLYSEAKKPGAWLYRCNTNRGMRRHLASLQRKRHRGKVRAWLQLSRMVGRPVDRGLTALHGAT